MDRLFDFDLNYEHKSDGFRRDLTKVWLRFVVKRQVARLLPDEVLDGSKVHRWIAHDIVAEQFDLVLGGNLRAFAGVAVVLR